MGNNWEVIGDGCVKDKKCLRISPGRGAGREKIGICDAFLMHFGFF